MTEYATSDEVGAKGLAWTKYEESGEITGGIAKFITDEIKEQLVNEFGMSKNEFKRAIGRLYKSKKIKISKTGIELTEE